MISSIYFVRLIGADSLEMLQVHKERAETLPDHSFCVRLISACKHHLVVDPELHHVIMLGDICATQTNIHMDKPFWMFETGKIHYSIFPKKNVEGNLFPLRCLNYLMNSLFLALATGYITSFCPSDWFPTVGNGQRVPEGANRISWLHTLVNQWENKWAKSSASTLVNSSRHYLLCHIVLFIKLTHNAITKVTPVQN